MKEESIPMKKVDVAKVFGIDTKMEVFGFEEPTERVPEVEESYVFDNDTTLSILAGFSKNRNLAYINFPMNGSDHVVYVSPNAAQNPMWTVICLTKDGRLNYRGTRRTERDPETRKMVDIFTLCSKGNTTQGSCTYRARQDSMYKVTIDQFANTKLYKLKNKNTWEKIDG